MAVSGTRSVLLQSFVSHCECSSHCHLCVLCKVKHFWVNPCVGTLCFFSGISIGVIFDYSIILIIDINVSIYNIHVYDCMYVFIITMSRTNFLWYRSQPQKINIIINLSYYEIVPFVYCMVSLMMNNFNFEHLSTLLKTFFDWSYIFQHGLENKT